MTRNPNYPYIAVWACGSTARLESECEARLRGLAHVPRMVDDGPVLGYVKYLTLITSIQVTITFQHRSTRCSKRKSRTLRFRPE